MRKCTLEANSTSNLQVADNSNAVIFLLACGLSSILILFCLQADVIERLRLQYNKDLLKIVDIVLSHQV